MQGTFHPISSLFLIDIPVNALRHSGNLSVAVLLMFSRLSRCVVRELLPTDLLHSVAVASTFKSTSVVLTAGRSERSTNNIYPVQSCAPPPPPFP